MGITGLLPLLKDIQRHTSVSIFRGKSVGIDAYCWLHKGVYGCAKDVVEGKKTNLYIKYVLKRVNMLLNYDITPILVFDGGYLPAKASKEKERRSGREENLKKGKAFLRAGNTTQAVECFQRCVEITPAMATEVIQACREKNVMCVVAPYEADAQLAYLEMQGITDFTITEDSDLLIYGCKKVLFKMGADGDGMLIDLNELNKVKSVALESFTMEKFRHMCILSGCDYLPSVKGLGLYKAHKFLKKSTNVYKAIQLIKSDKKLKVPDNYAEDFRKTDAVFKYQSVFDPRTKAIVRINEVSEADDVTDEELQYAGPYPLHQVLHVELMCNYVIHHEKPTEKRGEPDLLPSFVERQSKPRSRDLNYVVDEDRSELDELSLEDAYLYHLEKQAESKKQLEMAKEKLKKIEDDSSPPEKSLRNIRLYEKTNPQKTPSIGILYGESKRTESSGSTFGHHSVFVKRRHKHKFKNPFRFDNQDEEGDSNGNEAIKSQYFSIKPDNKENDTSAMNSSPSSGNEVQNSENEASEREMVVEEDLLKSPPPSKRAKFSFIKYLDSHSKDSLKREASKMSDSDSSFNSPENESVRPERVCQNEATKSLLINDMPSLKKDPLLPRCPEFLDDQKDSNNNNTLARFMFTKNSSCIDKSSTQRSTTKMSLFKAFNNTKSKPCDNNESNDDLHGSKDSDISLSQGSNQYDVIDLSSECTQSQREKSTAKESILQLKSRSISEPVISSSSSSLSRKALVGRCKKIGLSKKSRSSLDRVRENQSKLSQSKLEFQKFAYSQKKIDW
eukprot:gene20244-22226_t